MDKRPYIILIAGVLVSAGIVGRVWWLQREASLGTERVPPLAVFAPTGEGEKTTAGEPGPLKAGEAKLYYEVGVVPEGKYKGYKRIVGVREPYGPEASLFATQNNEKYVLDGDPRRSSSYPEDDYRNPLSYINAARLIGIDNVAVGHPRVIPLERGFALYRDELFVRIEYTRAEGEKYYSSRYSSSTDFSSYRELASPTPALRFYENSPSPWYTDDSIGRYLGADDGIIVVDSGGLAYLYRLVRTNRLPEYEDDLRVRGYVVPRLDLDVAADRIETTPDLFGRYIGIFPGGCSRASARVVRNINPEELVRIGRMGDVDLYVIGNKGHPLYRAAYEQKAPADIDDKTYESITGKPASLKPTFSDYVVREPLILIRDPWYRFFILQENDYPVPSGGCAKPVIYLYPPAPTEVSIRFAAPMRFTVDIPTYRNGWRVRANSDGTLEDLQPNATDCATIDFARHGSEYAEEACREGIYPYLYWAGQSPTRDMPTVEGGWVIDRDGLEPLLRAKLGEIGLTKREMTDMIEYWLQEILSKNTPFYRIAFLQTREMNLLAPVIISPEPDSLYRVFLIYKPLTSLPKEDIVPQRLLRIERKGFTVVEWGGLKR